ncbi:putative toxin-antitoxin system toxin component, PIN family [Thermosipho ferrireducens]|uniref:Toxin-antitoxin system toxin component, PIN family n=1 Tax=Thermosipho ferrireducens TaxID=2571116 RepID=A0ABX7S794_9BACT|nr:putative toxin-antitoxin system toxin component, PIN family [Thermosipho ferrireducens]QTA38473.1 putative toxin-antitoxin system toxin component, PIN family [Thermosipho ferrireducens]
MKTKVVVDTNVIVSGLIKPNSTPAKILNLILSGEFTICADSRIISEYNEVLLRDKFSFPKDLINDFISYLKSVSILVSPPSLPIKLTDSGDLPFIEVAYYLNIPIITGNTKHFKSLKNIKIFTPDEFIKIYKKI